MPSAITLNLNKTELLSLYFRLTQTQVQGGRLAAVVTLMTRMLREWPELGDGGSEAEAKAIPETERRALSVLNTELSAVADAFLRLLQSDTIVGLHGVVPLTSGTKRVILNEAALFSPGLKKYLMEKLSAEKLEPWVEPVDLETEGEDLNPFTSSP